MKKNLLALLLLVTMLVNILAMSSCNLFGGNESLEEEGKVNITFYHTMGSNLSTVLNNYIEVFEDQFPFINVIHSQVGSYDDVRDTVSTELSVGAQPNITYCYPDHVALYNVALAVTVLDDYIDYEGDFTFSSIAGNPVTVSNIGLTQEQKDDFIQGYYEEGRQFGDGKMYTLPLSKSTEVLYYNKTFFEKEGLTVPTTWDEMEEVCAAIKAKYPESTPLGYDSEANWFITMCEQLDTPYTSADKSTGHFLFDDAKNHEFVKRFREWYVKGYVTTKEILDGYTSDIFKTQTSYMSIGSSAGATHQAPTNGEFEVGIVPIPQADANNKKVISQGPSLCILENADREEVMASWLFVKFLTTNVDFQAEFSEVSGYVPVIKSVANDDYYKNEFLAFASGYKDGIAALSAQVCLAQESYYYTSPAFNGSSTARDQVGALLQTCFAIDGNGKTDAQIDAAIRAAFKDAVEECEYQVGQN